MITCFVLFSGKTLFSDVRGRPPNMPLRGLLENRTGNGSFQTLDLFHRLCCEGQEEMSVLWFPLDVRDSGRG